MLNEKIVTDMTRGKETSLILKFMVPLLLGNMFQQIYNLADSVIVGRHEGATALGAIGCTGAVTYVFFSASFGIATGAGIIVSQYFGAGNATKVKRTLVNSFFLVVLFGLMLSMLGIVLTRPLLELLGTPLVQIENAVDYMHIICGGTIAVALYNYASQTMRSLGDSKTPLVFLVISSILNVCLDILFVIKLNFGVKGAAWATIISQGVSALLCLVYAFSVNPYFHFKKEDIRIDKEISKLCIKIGLPLAAQTVMISLSSVILQRVVNSFSEVAVSAFTVTSRISDLVAQPFLSLSAAMSTFTGQNMGAGQSTRVKTGLKKCVKITVYISMVMSVACFAAGNLIMSMFVKDQDVIRLGAEGLRIISVMFFPLGMIFVIRGLLNGAGDSIYSMINGLIEIICRIGFSLILVFVIPIGIKSIWFATGFTWCVVAICAAFRYKQGVWIRKKIKV